MFTFSSNDVQPIFLHSTQKSLLYCPELKVNLISVPRLMERGCNVYFENGACAVWRGKQKVLSAVQKNGLYVISGKTEQVHSAMEWHRKLAHFGQMEKLADTVVGLPTNLKWTANSCKTCIQAKQARSAIPKGNEENQAKTGELLHMDLMGPITPAGKNGERYIVSILDEKSKLGVAKPICNKSQASGVIKTVIRMMEKQTGNVVKVVRSDRGTEFLNAVLQNFLAENGIQQQTSAPYTPQQNGNAERYNRTTLEKVRAVLLDCGLDKCFWNFAVEYCAFVRNRLPCQPHGHTPYEVVFGQKPDVSSMHIFGETCYVLKTPAELTGKMDAKSKSGFFVGIEPGTKDTCRIWSGGKVILSRNVTFLGMTETPSAETDDTVAEPSPLPLSSDLLDSQPLVETQTTTVDNPETAEQETTEETDASENIRSSIAENRRYPLRERRQPQPYWTANVCLTDPLTLEEALGSPQHDDWKLALQEEVSSLSEQDVFDVVDRAPEMKTLPCKWIFKVKYDQDGNIQRFKARLVAKGFKQVAGIDFGETFAPVAKQSTLRLLWTLAAKRDWEVENIDIKTAFLNGDLDEEIYMDMPPGFELSGKVWKLKKTLYGLKQAPRAWHIKLTDVLEKLGFRCSTADPGLYVGEDMLLMVYVDDLLLCGNGRTKVEEVKQSLLTTFEGRDLGPTDHFLGIKMERNRSGKTVLLSQETYVNNVLERFRMADCHSVSTPLELGTKWTSDAAVTESNFPYQELVGCLMYLAVSTRPDIAYVTNRLARYVSSPSSNHVAVAKRVLKYLHGTKSVGILLGDSSPSFPGRLL